MNHLLIELFDLADGQTNLLDQEEKVTAKELASNIPQTTDRELLDLWEDAERAASLMGRIRDAVGERVNSQIELPVRDGERWYHYGGYKKTKVLDSGRLIDYLGDRWHEVIPIERVRVTALDAIARDRGDDPDAVRDTFVNTNWTGPRKLRAGPVSKAPKTMKLNALGE